MKRPHPRKWIARRLPAEAVGSMWQGVLFSWSGMMGLGLVALGFAWAWDTPLPLLLAGGAQIGAVARGHYAHTMAMLAPQLEATDEDREVAKLHFEAVLRQNQVAGGPPWLIERAAHEAMAKGVPVEELQAISDRLAKANFGRGS